MAYNPTPLDTFGVELGKGLEEHVELLAEITHNIWVAQRIREGWQYGPERSDERRTYPNLVPYADLPDGEKRYDRVMAAGLVQAIIALGFIIEVSDGEAE